MNEGVASHDIGDNVSDRLVIVGASVKKTSYNQDILNVADNDGRIIASSHHRIMNIQF
jgi:uncharacterized protein (UPF0371 family)